VSAWTSSFEFWRWFAPRYLLALRPTRRAVAAEFWVSSPTNLAGNVGGATVTINGRSSRRVADLTTDSDGAYVALNLLPGTYAVRAEFKGFKIFERKNILVEVGKDARIDAVLQPGSTTETITITEEVPMVDTTSTTLGGTISNEIINDLPLNGRNYQNLVSLRPGTMIYPGGGPWTRAPTVFVPKTPATIVDGITNDEASWA